MSSDVQDHVWLLSGVDAFRHAFVAEGGYVPTYDWAGLLPSGGEQDDREHGAEWFGPYEVVKSLCGEAVPVAMVLTAFDGPRAGSAPTECRSSPAPRPSGAPSADCSSSEPPGRWRDAPPTATGPAPLSNHTSREAQWPR